MSSLSNKGIAFFCIFKLFVCFEKNENKHTSNRKLKKRGGMESHLNQTNQRSTEDKICILNDLPIPIHEITKFTVDNDRKSLYYQSKYIKESLGKDGEGLNVDFVSIKEPKFVDHYWKKIDNPNKGSYVRCWKRTHPAHTQDTLKSAIEAYLNPATREQTIREWGKIENWNVSNVTNMESMFDGAVSFNQNIGGWNVSNVTNMESMFDGAVSFNQNIGGWNVSKVTDMSSMFAGALRFNQNIGGWDVSNVTDMNSMFAEAQSFNQNIGRWNVSNVINMNSMFLYASNFNQNIGEWNVSNVINMDSMFAGAVRFNQSIDGWNVSKVKDMRIMFAGAENFNQNIGGWNVSNVTNMSYMFDTAKSFNQNIAKWNVSNVKKMEFMFDGAVSFNQYKADGSGGYSSRWRESIFYT